LMFEMWWVKYALPQQITKSQGDAG
jgi:hypothetical protein